MGPRMGRFCVAGTLYAPDGARKYLNADERGRFLAAAERVRGAERTFALVLAYTGCRISEALGLSAGDFQSSGVVSIRCLKKRGKLVVREVPVPSWLAGELMPVHGSEPASGQRSGLLWPWGRTRGWQVIKDIMRTAGIAHAAASPKGLRHGFGVHAVCSGVPLNLVQKWLGHEDIATTAIYTNVLGPEERAIAARMW